jgi:uncharacterized membrane protein
LAIAFGSPFLIPCREQRLGADILVYSGDADPSPFGGTLMAFCNMCGAQIADGTTTCAACASRIPATPAGTPAAPTAGMADNVAGMLAYVTVIPAIIFLVMEPYNRSRFVRFHSWQCISFLVGIFIVHVALSILGFVPLMGLLTIPLHGLIFLGTIIVLIVCALKANQNQMFKLPIVGDFAEKQANAM